MAAERDLDQSFVIYAHGFAVAPEGEFCDGIESREEDGNMRENIRFGLEGEALAALSFHKEPPPADESAAVPITGAQELKNQSQAFIRNVIAVIISSKSIVQIRGAIYTHQRRMRSIRH